VCCLSLSLSSLSLLSFSRDLASNTLPSVSYFVAPTALSEHATNHPAAGEDLSARLLAQLRAHPEVYKKTAFVINYDEGGQFFVTLFVLCVCVCVCVCLFGALLHSSFTHLSVACVCALSTYVFVLILFFKFVFLGSSLVSHPTHLPLRWSLLLLHRRRN
jgi:uncharacterized membrane protein